MIPRLPTYLCLAFGLALAGCTPPASEWTPAEAPTAPSTSLMRYHYLAAYPAGGVALSRDGTTALAAFLAEAKAQPGAHLYLVPALGDRLAAARIGHLTQDLGRRGIAAEALPAASGIAPNHVLVLVDRYVVTPPACPNWTKSPISDHDNEPASNFGCATATDLALMIDDPRDLETGRTLDPATGEPAIDPVTRYRAGKVKPLIGGSASGDAGASAASGGGTTAGSQ